MSFKTLGLQEELLTAIEKKGYKVPSSVQQQAIPMVLLGKDIIGCAQTGTGKTAAFALPLLQLLSQKEAKHKRAVRALILAPTRELALQIDQEIKKYGTNIKLKSSAIFGGVDINAQTKIIKAGLDIIIATPGRLIDHLDRKNIRLDSIEYLVLDEADRMLDMGFIHDVKKIIAKTPTTRQTLLFSATISPEINELSKFALKNPEFIQIEQNIKPADSVEQIVLPVCKSEKAGLLLYLLNFDDFETVIIFSRTRYGADKIFKFLTKNNVKATVLHSDKSQNQRQAALNNFKSGSISVLIATDIAARGIDVSNISHVINYDVPETPEDYVHRIGRTGRAEKFGQALTFVDNEELKKYFRIRTKIKNIEIRECPPYTDLTIIPQPKIVNKSKNKRRRK